MKVPPPPQKPTQKPKRAESRAKERRVRDAIANARLRAEPEADGDTASISLARDKVEEEFARRDEQRAAEGGAAQAPLAREETRLERPGQKAIFEDEGKKRKKARQRPKEEAEEAIEIGDALERGGRGASRAHLFQQGEKPQPGDVAFLEPEEIRRAMETPIAYAKHVMILAEAFRRTTGATRAEALDYLARMFVCLRDLSFARTALKQFGPATGILDIYPLEVVAHVLGRWPWFLPKMGFATFTRASALETDTVTPIILEYPERLEIRGFALVGGGRPGYVFQPAIQPGKYALGIQSPGEFEILISALTKSGHTIVESSKIKVRSAARLKRAKSVREKPSLYPPRDPAKLAAWPVPPAPRMPDEALREMQESADGSPFIPRGALAPLPLTDPRVYAALMMPDPSAVEPLPPSAQEDPTARIDAGQLGKPSGFADLDDDDVTRPIEEDDVEDIDGPTIADLGEE